MVIGLGLLLVTLLGGTLTALNNALTVGESQMHRRQAFHAAEGISLAALELASSKLQELPQRPNLSDTDPGHPAALATLLATNTATTNTFLNDPTTTPSLVPEGFSLVPVGPGQPAIVLDQLGEGLMRELTAGPFQGMLAMVQPLRLRLAVRRDHGRTPATQHVEASVERATMSMFQFYVFSDVYLDLDPGGPVSAKGRIHTNADFCVAGEPIIDTVTAAGAVWMSNRSGQRCRRRATETNDIRIATNDGFTTFATLDRDHDAADWLTFTRTTLAGHVQDSAHGVKVLRMPLSGTPRVQAGANVLAMEQVSSLADNSLLVPISQAKEDNTTSMRFLVDPLLVSEPTDVREQKFAFKADVRIIDGVWFVRRPEAPEDIGEAIWSDHPGTGSTSFQGNESDDIRTQVIGQEDLRTLQGWANTPGQFSYYGFEPDPSAAGQLRAARTGAGPRAVISYGLLFNEGSNVFAPGHYATTPTTTSAGAIARSTTLDQFLGGTRNGFKDGWLETRSETIVAPPASGPGNSAVEAQRSRMLPINFDVAAFIDALQTCAAGQRELGSYFPGSCAGGSGGRRFNGVVYVAATWPGALDGLGSTPATSGFAKLAPFQGDVGGEPNPGLPLPLCFPSAAAPPTLSGTTTALSRCDQMGRATTNKAFPNVLRVMNAQHISPPSNTVYAGVNIRADTLADGLTIATNLPVIAVGDVNVDTTPRRLRTDPVAGPDHFVPFLIAGDRFYRFSRAWSDHLANWVQPMNANLRDSAETTQYLEILAGWNPTPSTPLAGHDHSSDGFEDFPRYLECWNDPVHFAGSIVVGFASVYTRSGANNGDGDINDPGGSTRRTFAACFPGRDEGYDFHLEDPANQPPGAPQLLAQSTTAWVAR